MEVSPESAPSAASASPAVAPISVRWIETRDAEAVREIYNREVEHSTVTFDMVPRTLDEQVAWIDDHTGSYPALVAVAATDQIVGFAALSPYRPRPAYSTTVENSVYVHRDARGQGVGRILMQALVETAADHGYHSIIARIVGNHDTSIALHQAVGFEIIGREHEIGRKFGRWLDVVIMQRML